MRSTHSFLCLCNLLLTTISAARTLISDDFPWIVQVHTSESCLGVAIASNLVLSPANCIGSATFVTPWTQSNERYTPVETTMDPNATFALLRFENKTLFPEYLTVQPPNSSVQGEVLYVENQTWNILTADCTIQNHTVNHVECEFATQSKIRNGFLVEKRNATVAVVGLQTTNSTRFTLLPSDFTTQQNHVQRNVTETLDTTSSSSNASGAPSDHPRPDDASGSKSTSSSLQDSIVRIHIDSDEDDEENPENQETNHPHQWLLDAEPHLVAVMSNHSDETIGILISSSHVLLMSSPTDRWTSIDHHGQLISIVEQFVHASGLMVLQLASTVDDAEPKQLLAEAAAKDVVFERAMLLLAEQSGPSDTPSEPPSIQALHNLKFLSEVTDCGMEASDAMLCAVHSMEEENDELDQMKNTTIGYVEQDGFLVGFAIDAYRHVNQTQVFQGLSWLGSPDLRQFIENATQHQAMWTQLTPFTDETKAQSIYPTYLAKLMASDDDDDDDENDDTPEAINCMGVLISPKHMLATASCVLALGKRLERAVFATYDGQEQEAMIKEGGAIIHPLYDSADDYAVDISVIELAHEVGIEPVALDVGTGPGELLQVGKKRQTRMGIASTHGKSEDLFSSRVTLLPTSSSCESASMHASSIPFHEALCVKPTPDTAVAVEASPRTRGRKAKCSLPFRKAVGNPLIKTPSNTNEPVRMVGVAAALGDDDCDPDLYVSVAKASNFINAYSRGHSWGRKRQPVAVNAAAPPPPSSLLPENKRFVVGIRATKDGQNFCGGSLIAPMHVLTAAHCVTDKMAKWVSIGSKASFGAENTEPIAIVQSSIKIHPSYGKPHPFSFDAAILELQVAAYATPVILDRSRDYATGRFATMYGYGLVAPTTSTLSPVVRVLELPLWSRDDCKRVLSNIDDSMLCAGGEAGKDACTGDSGGPLVLTDQGRDYLVGFVSSGHDCGLNGVPGIYMRVSELQSFLNSFAITPKWRSKDSSDEIEIVTPAPAQCENCANVRPRARPLVDDDTHPLDGLDQLGGTFHHHSHRIRGSMASEDDHGAIVSTALPTRSFTPSFRSVLVGFLVGDDSLKVLNGPFYNDLMRSDRLLSLHSTGDVTALYDRIVAHSKKPLYSREDRFHSSASRPVSHRHQDPKPANPETYC